MTQKYRILAVEDDRGKELLEEMEMNLFTSAGFGIEKPDESHGEYLVCTSCPQAIRQIASSKERPYDFILSDLNLTSYHQNQIIQNDPVLSFFSDKKFGTWIWRFIVESELPSRIILYTAQEEFNDLLEGLKSPKLGIDVYTYKDRPNWNELISQLKNLVAQFQIEILSRSEHGRELARVVYSQLMQIENSAQQIASFLDQEIELLNIRGIKEKWKAGDFFLNASLLWANDDGAGASNIIKDILERSMKSTPRPQSIIFPLEKEFYGMVGISRAMQEIFDLIRKCADSSCCILITGETGTGKELIARALHKASSRHQKPFVTIDCSAIPKELIESELFGHVKGAFSGAFKDKTGLFQEAHGGTIFLDEIGDMPIDLQVKLLRVLEGREIRKVGDTKYDHVDVRVIAATNANLSTAVNEKTFRKDLYYRLATMPIPVPPLRERPEDIEVLVPCLLERCLAAKEFKAIPEIHPEVIPFLKRQLWPGNVRDLRSCLIRSILQLPEGEILTVERTLLDNADFKNDTTGTSPIKIFYEITRGQRPATKLSELADEFGKTFVLQLVALAIRELGKGKWPKEDFTKRFFNESEGNFRQWPHAKGYDREKLMALLS